MARSFMKISHELSMWVFHVGVPCGCSTWLFPLGVPCRSNKQLRTTQNGKQLRATTQPLAGLTTARAHMLRTYF